MGKIRVYELAKRLNLPTKELMRLLDKLEMPVKSHMSTLEPENVVFVEDYLKKLQQPVEKGKAAKEKPSEKEIPEKIEYKKESLDKKEKAERNKVLEKTKYKKPKGRVETYAKKEKPQVTRYSEGQKGKHRKKIKKAPQKAGEKQEASVHAAVKKITIGDTITVKELGKKLGVSPAEIVKKLMELGVVANINQNIDAETADIISSDYGVKVKIKSDRNIEVEEIKDNPSLLKSRSPVVAVLGHVDHGKTSLLDAIRETKVTDLEAGGITQHMGAYQVNVGDKKITFLDTPGHEAFTAMRARGAHATDIAILVVAADDGVMPQTVEAINHAKSAGVPLVVAINKIDKPGANVEKVKQQLTEYGLVPEEWGGETICVPVSAVKKEGLDTLLEMILLVAEVNELKANPDRPASGIIIEAQLDKGRGPVATMLVQKGTLRVGDGILAGLTYGKVRAMFNDEGKRVNQAGPSMPVEVQGLADLPEAGDNFQVMENEKLAREIAEKRREMKREKEITKKGKATLEELFKKTGEQEIKELNLIIKGDVQGSVEALKQALERLNEDKVAINVIHSGVGAITESDVMLASASNAIIIGFNVRPEINARKAAEREKVDIKLYRVIYEITDDIKAAMEGLLEPEIKEVLQGEVEVRAIFKIPKGSVIAGGYVREGKIYNNSKVRIVRGGVVIHEGRVESLKRFKNDVREVTQGYECGIGVEKFNDIKEGDIIEAYTLEEVQKEL